MNWLRLCFRRRLREGWPYKLLAYRSLRVDIGFVHLRRHLRPLHPLPLLPLLPRPPPHLALRRPHRLQHPPSLRCWVVLRLWGVVRVHRRLRQRRLVASRRLHHQNLSRAPG
jgi:hypothetical protein